LLLASLAVFAAGCGDAEPPAYPSDGSDEEQIRAVVEIANVAIANGDGDVLCRDVLPSNGRADSEQCGDELTAAMQDAPENWPDEDLEVHSVTVNDGAATAAGVVDGREEEYEFVHQRGRWRMVWFD
jgi:hypothetical protein